MKDYAGLTWPALAVSLSLALALIAFLSNRLREQARKREQGLREKIDRLQTRLDQAETFLAIDPHVLVAWTAPDENPEIIGTPSPPVEISASSCAADQSILNFASWLPAEDARMLEAHVSRLLHEGERFHLSFPSRHRYFDFEGAPIGSHAVMRIRDVSGVKLDFLRLRDEQNRILSNFTALRGLLDAIPHPAWQRDDDGHISWVNHAYAQAIEARDRAEAVTRGIELLDRPARDASEALRAAGQIWKARCPAIMMGARRMLDVIEMPVAAEEAASANRGQDSTALPQSGCKAAIAMASDVSELEAMRAAHAQQIEAHARTLDQLTTAVAIFDRTKRLVFHNTAYRQLWALDQAWLDQGPSDGEILDRLRAARLLPEQADFRSWKEDLFTAYQAIEMREQLWYLPDGRTLRSVITPNPEGGVTYLFDDTTERFHLESRFNAAIRVQSETLDTLQEGVAVFGSDGRLKLFNPAFVSLWHLDAESLGGEPHIDKVASLCTPLQEDPAAWSNLRTMVASLQEERLGLENRLTRRDGSVLDYAAAPLPDGATLVTFIDVTASVNIERALTERNQALLDAEKLRNDFVHHVSYELRSPLTNIIGFIEMLAAGAVGPLTERQHEYIGYVMASSSALMAIINDILDLASIDADAMDLSLESVDITETMQAASEGVQDRLRESALTLTVTAEPGIGSFQADGKRIRQILFNLLSNAIGFSEPGQTVTLSAARSNGHVVFKVQDQGCGIPDDVVEHVFDRFKTHTGGSNHRGVGLGLSIVRSFVELHGGKVLVETAPGKGTTMTCIFPAHDRSDGRPNDGTESQALNGIGAGNAEAATRH